MVFPTTTADWVTDLFLGSQWVDISTKVYQRADVKISNRGQPDELGNLTAGRCQATLNNRDGRFAEQNPLGTYYGLLGRNNPFRFARRIGRDTFSTTRTDTWGTADSGQTWTILVGAAADFDAAAGVGTQACTAANTVHLAVLNDTLADAMVRVDWRMGFTNVTGGAIEPGTLPVRVQDASNYYYVKPSIATDETITLALYRRVAGTDTLLAGPTATGITHTSGQWCTVAALIEGNTLAGKIWITANGEPYPWTVTYTDTSTSAITTAGKAGVRTGVAAGNTNVTFTVDYDNFEFRSPRYAGFVPDWPQERDITGADKVVTVTAAGPTRRLRPPGNGAARPQISTIRRGLTTLATLPVAYWPCEDGKDAGVIASGLTGGIPGTFTGSPNFATNSAFAASDSLPEFNQSEWGLLVPTYTSPNAQAQVRFLLSVPAAGDTAATGATVLRTHTTGSAAIWDLQYTTTGNGSLTLRVYDSSQVLLQASAETDFTLKGRPVRVSLELDQNGANIDWTVRVMGVPAKIGTGSSTTVSGTLNSQTLNVVWGILAGVGHLFTSTAVGHISVERDITPETALINELAAWAYETCTDRLIRLCGYEGIPFSYVGAAAGTARMGPQGVKTTLDLLTDCAAADMGILYETRGHPGLLYRSRASLYNQPATAALTLSAGEVDPATKPKYDDLPIRNDITVKRPDGSEYRAVQTTGTLNTSEKPTDSNGVGSYPERVTMNVFDDTQLPDVAGWRRWLGTQADPRFPTLTVNLANPDVVANTSLTAGLLDVEVGKRVTIDGATSWYRYDDITQLVFGLDEVCNSRTHTLTLACAPERPYEISVADNAAAKADFDGITVRSPGITSTSATSFDVDIAAGKPLITTAGGQMPIPIVIDGERMSVTAVSGAATPQTLTVTRNVNGAARTHATGATVKLWQRPTAGL